MKIVK